jgi:hypothetical protein
MFSSIYILVVEIKQEHSAKNDYSEAETFHKNTK